MKILSAIMLAAALTLAGLAAASPASGFVSPETAAAAQRADAESRAAELNLDVRPIVAGCRAEAVSPQQVLDSCVARRVNIFIAQRTTTPESTANVGVSVGGDSVEPVYTETIQEAIDAERAEGPVSPIAIGFCTNSDIFETEDEQVTCIRGIVEADLRHSPANPHRDFAPPPATAGA